MTSNCWYADRLGVNDDVHINIFFGPFLGDDVPIGVSLLKGVVVGRTVLITSIELGRIKPNGLYRNVFCGFQKPNQFTPSDLRFLPFILKHFILAV